MSLQITRNSTQGLYIIKPRVRGINAVTTDNLDEVAAAIAHYFRTDQKRHDIFKKRGLCPFCEAIKEEAEG